MSLDSYTIDTITRCPIWVTFLVFFFSSDFRAHHKLTIEDLPADRTGLCSIDMQQIYLWIDNVQSMLCIVQYRPKMYLYIQMRGKPKIIRRIFSPFSLYLEKGRNIPTKNREIFFISHVQQLKLLNSFIILLYSAVTFHKIFKNIFAFLFLSLRRCVCAVLVASKNKMIETQK